MPKNYSIIVTPLDLMSEEMNRLRTIASAHLVVSSNDGKLFVVKDRYGPQRMVGLYWLMEWLADELGIDIAEPENI